MRINWKESIGKNINGFLIKDIKRDGKYTYAFAECPYCHKDSWIRADRIKAKTATSCGCQGRKDWEKSIGDIINGFKIKDYKRENNRTMVYAECPRCHKDKWIRADYLEKIVSCGCYNEEVNYLQPIDISGKTYKYLKATRPTDKRDKDGNIFWECECVCGKIVYVEASRFIRGEVASCGCKRSEMQSEIAKALYENGKQEINEYRIANTDVRKITSKKLISTNTSGHTGVTWDRTRNKWLAQIIFQGKNYHLGRYEDKKLAIEAREKAEEMLHGDFLHWYAETYPDKWNKLQNVKGKRND